MSKTKHQPSTNSGRKPDYNAFSVMEAGQKSRWLKVGAAFINKDGSISVLLDAVPLSGKLVLQEPKEDA